MVNFMCQLDCATGYPDIWLKIILDVSVKVFLDKLTLESVDRAQQIALPNVDRPHLIIGDLSRIKS